MVAAATLLAVVQELRTPAEQRTWHGEVFGFVPYDFRRPTLERVRTTIWSPRDPQVLKPRIFGVGWTPNLGRLAAMATEAARRQRHGSRPGGSQH